MYVYVKIANQITLKRKKLYKRKKERKIAFCRAMIKRIFFTVHALFRGKSGQRIMQTTVDTN